MKNFIEVKNLKKPSFIVVIGCNILTAFLLYLQPEKVNILLSFLNLSLILLYLLLSVKNTPDNFPLEISLIPSKQEMICKAKIRTIEKLTPINNVLPDLTYEFSELLKFTSNVAIDIRLYSAYGRGMREDANGQLIDIQSDPNTPYDLMYLSDILHNFFNLAMAIDHGDIENIISACDSHIYFYECYLGKHPVKLMKMHMMGNPVDTFERHKKYVDLNMAIQIFEQIKTKCIAKIENLNGEN